MMKSVFFLFALMATLAASFAPALAPRTTSSLAFFGGSKKPAAKEEEGFLDGKGKRITIRDDEDNDMWVEEDDKGKRTNPDKKKGGK
jgi:hypothetical protein